MQLTGKTKEEFEKWYDRYESIFIETTIGVVNTNVYDCNFFSQLPQSMQIGVLILYFDSVGIDITISIDNIFVQCFKYIVNRFEGYTRTRQEAWTQAVERALEIREERLK